MSERKFKFDLEQTVRLSQSGETGSVIARLYSAYAENWYFVRYTAADGRLQEVWWGESSLEAVKPGS
jgi:hypothetical protein